MNKLISYFTIILIGFVLALSCEKSDRTFDAKRSESMALVQIFNQMPVTDNITTPPQNFQFIRVFLNDIDVARGGNTPLTQWNALSTSLGRYFEVEPGEVRIRLSQDVLASGTPTEVYNQNTAALRADQKYGLILYDFNQPPMIVEEPMNHLPTRPSMDTDTVSYVRFFNLMRESPGINSPLKLQYQYRYIINPLWTLKDLEEGKIPPGSIVGGAVPNADRILSDWIDIGKPLSFGEETGWVEIATKKVTYVTQGTQTCTFRILVVEGGDVGIHKNAENELLCRSTRAATGTLAIYRPELAVEIGRYRYHFFSGYRDGGAPGMSMSMYYQK
jgi:hypothetical protein